MCQRRLSLLSLALAIVGVPGLFAAPLELQLRREVDALMSDLQTSGCEFNRNGSWYSGADAKDHILQKLAYIEARTELKTTEQFIKLAASTSSMSGKPYQVRCAGTSPISSEDWLLKRLSALRASAVKPPEK